MTIAAIRALEILDSRGNPTLKVIVTTREGAVGQSSVPSGASTGEYEACELRDRDAKRYGGKGVLAAVGHVNGPIHQLLCGKSVFDQEEIDAAMIALDATPNKSRLGANALIGVSLAVAHAAAAAKRVPLYRSLGLSHATLLPCPMMNIINGGAHADNCLDIQEFMIRPVGASHFREAVRWGVEVFHCLKGLLRQKKYSSAVGDEGGFAPPIDSDEEALELILSAIHQAGFRAGVDITIALDVAASELFDDGYYREKKRGARGKKLSSEEQVAYLSHLVSKYPIDSIEDGLDQNDWAGRKLLTQHLGSAIQVVGDDIFVTNTRLFERGIQEQVANAILIKPNQIGTLTETIAAIRLAKQGNYRTIISHRSGETEDVTIADLAVAFRIGQIKTGSLSRSDRTAKYNRLLEIENELGIDAEYSSFA